MAALSPAAATRPEASAPFLTRPTTCSCAGTHNEGPARVRAQDGALRVPRGTCHDRFPFPIKRPDVPGAIGTSHAIGDIHRAAVPRPIARAQELWLPRGHFLGQLLHRGDARLVHRFPAELFKSLVGNADG